MLQEYVRFRLLRIVNHLPYVTLFAEAAGTAHIIAKQEQEMGNYKQAISEEGGSERERNF